jgi:hypothetical protein
VRLIADAGRKKQSPEGGSVITEEANTPNVPHIDRAPARGYASARRAKGVPVITLAAELRRIAAQIERWARYDDVPAPGLDDAEILKQAAERLATQSRREGKS